ncbi:MAG: GNAT family N-acetyltransferase, partial [Mesorhizobium sp.]
MSMTIAPLTPERWADFEDLFGKQGACYGCWCTHFRLAPAERRASDKERNKD